MNVKIVETTPFGPVALAWGHFEGAPKIVRVLLSKPGAPATAGIRDLFADARPASCREVDVVAAGIGRFLAGEDIAFSLDIAALKTCPAFQQAVLCAEHAIPRGQVSTYGLIALHLGRPGASRGVGNALAANPFPLLVPCHRAVRADRSLGGYQGGSTMKRTLLEREGIAFDRAGRVAVARFHYA
jgi:methylated-DNA-[protein]-cysteine S-methyltransferase